MATTRENKTISQFKAALIGGGARPNLFEVELTTLPAGINWDADNFRYMCKAASLPASNIANIDVPFRGRIFKVAGDRTFDVWTVKIINDLGATDPTAYMTNAKVYQLGRGQSSSSKTSDGNANAVLKEYEFVDIFPTNISAIDLSYDSSDAIEEFTVDFQVQTFSLAGAGGPNG